MNEVTPLAKARFRVGEQVRIVGPSAKAHPDKTGTVTDITAGPDQVFRYRVRFNDETTAVFFGFELVSAA